MSCYNEISFSLHKALKLYFCYIYFIFLLYFFALRFKSCNKKQSIQFVCKSIQWCRHIHINFTRNRSLVIFCTYMCKICHLLGIPDTSLRGLNTRTARRVLRSKSEPTVDRILDRYKEWESKKHEVSAGLIWNNGINNSLCNNREFAFNEFIFWKKKGYDDKGVMRAHVNHFTSRLN